MKWALKVKRAHKIQNKKETQTGAAEDVEGSGGLGFNIRADPHPTIEPERRRCCNVGNADRKAICAGTAPKKDKTHPEDGEQYTPWIGTRGAQRSLRGD